MELLTRDPVTVLGDDEEIYTVRRIDWLGFEIITDSKGKGVSTTRDLGVNILKFAREELCRLDAEREGRRVKAETSLDMERIKRRVHATLVPYYLKPAAIATIENEICKIVEDEVRNVDQ